MGAQHPVPRRDRRAPLGVQAKLLRVLQEREIQVIGASQVTKVDVRVIAATHRDLAAEVRAAGSARTSTIASTSSSS